MMQDRYMPYRKQHNCFNQTILTISDLYYRSKHRWKRLQQYWKHWV